MKKNLTLLFCIILYTGNAQNWKVITPFNNTSTILDMKVTPNSTLYVIAQHKNMFKSTDGGITRTSVGIPSDLMNSGED